MTTMERLEGDGGENVEADEGGEGEGYAYGDEVYVGTAGEDERSAGVP